MDEWLNALTVYDRQGRPFQDPRLARWNHTCTRYDMPDYTLEEWQARREAIRRQILVACGLYPALPRRRLNARVFGAMEIEGVVIEKVEFKPVPGLKATGNLYRPAGAAGPLPAIVSPHGHCAHGRVQRDDLFDIPMRGVDLARAGMAALVYDMVGYNDSRPLMHRPRRPSEEAEELYGFSLAGLQTLTSIRAVDLLLTLPYVDPARIGCTGASGGGTQTMLLCAVDERIAAAAPAVMVSHVYQGGCFCENTALLRVDLNNLEIAAMMAPKPMLLPGCDRDWTAHNPDEITPMVREIYDLYGAGDRIDSFQQDAEHNYNRAAREAVVTFFGRVFLGREEPFTEAPFPMPPVSALRIRAEELTEAPGERAKLFTAWKNRVSAAARRMAANPRQADALRAAMAVVIGPEDDPPRLEEKPGEQVGDITVRRFVVEGRRGRFPMVVAGRGGEKKVLLMAHPGGKAALARRPALRQIMGQALGRGLAVAAADVFLTGEYHKPWAQSGRDRTGSGLPPQEFEWVDYFTCYNYADDALRVQDVINAARALMSLGYAVDVAAYGGASAWVAAALPFLDGVDNVTLCSDGLPENDEAAIGDFFVPGLGTVGGLETFMRLGRQRRLRRRPPGRADG